MTTGTTSTGGASAGGSGGDASAGGSSSTGAAGGGGGGGLSPLPGAEGFDCSPATGEAPSLALRDVATGFVDPLFVTYAPGDTSRLFVVEQAGRILVLVDGEVQEEPFLDIVDNVQRDGNEQGLLGLAFHPDYADNGRFFVNYTARGGVNGAANGGTIVSEFTASSEPNSADAGSERVLLSVDQPYANHNGGMLAFGPDGYLYLGFGDGGSGGDPQGNAQNLDSLLGKILRIDVDASDAGEYGIPSNNLPGAAPEVWDYGLRNPWRFSFDGCTGDLYIADVGQDEWEELNIAPRGRGHDNFGWNVREGQHCYQANSCDFSNMVEPLVEYGHGVGVSITGGFVYRGSLIPSMRGTYFYADFDRGGFFALEYVDGEVKNQRELTEELDTGDGQITSFGQDAAGEVYVVRRFGAIQRIEPAP
jgi:glucose/arabinose dehydrogenase